MRELALFAGAGGGLLASHLLGWSTVCAVEFDEYARAVLYARQRDGLLKPFPIWDDVRTFDGAPWRGSVDIISGGFPCQDISSAGSRAGIEGERSGLWSEFARIIGEVRPRFVFVENSPNLTSRGLGRVLGDLAAMGFDAEWCVLGANDLGAPHLRKRIWILAAHFSDASIERCAPGTGRECETRWWSVACDGGHDVSNSDGERCQGLRFEEQAGIESSQRGQPHRCGNDGGFNRTATWPIWPSEPDLGRVIFDGMAHRVDRLRAIGNGQVPRVAAAAFALLRARGGW